MMSFKKIALLLLLVPLFAFISERVYKTFNEESYATGDKILVTGIYFEYDKFGLRPIAVDTLKKVADFLQLHPSYVIEIGVHTDERGSVMYNQLWSKKMAKVIRNVLNDEYQIDTLRVAYRGYGETDPIISNDSIAKLPFGEKDRAYSINRRVEALILKTE